MVWPLGRSLNSFGAFFPRPGLSRGASIHVPIAVHKRIRCADADPLTNVYELRLLLQDPTLDENVRNQCQQWGLTDMLDHTDNNLYRRGSHDGILTHVAWASTRVPLVGHGQLFGTANPMVGQGVWWKKKRNDKTRRLPMVGRGFKPSKPMGQVHCQSLLTI